MKKEKNKAPEQMQETPVQLTAPQAEKRLDKDMLRFIFHKLVLLILLVFALVNAREVLRLLGELFSLLGPFLLGCGFAFLINVLMRPLEAFWQRLWKKSRSGLPGRLKRPVCMVLSTLILLGIVFTVVFMMIPGLQQSGEEFIGNLPRYEEKISGWWNGLVHFAAQYEVILPEYRLDSVEIVERVTSFIKNEASGILTVTLDATTSILSTVVSIVLGLIFALYMLAQKEQICAHLKKLVLILLPRERAEFMLRVADLSNRTFTYYVSGQMIEALILGALCFAGMLILNIPYAGVISVFIGFTALIPVFGAWVGGGLGVVLILLSAPNKALWFALFLLVLQQLEDNLIYPKVVGKSVGLPGLMVLLAVTVGGSALGMLGMLFGVPVCAVLYTLYLEFIAKGKPLKKAK